MRSQPRRARAFRRVTMPPTALDTNQKANPERHREALEELKEGGIGHSPQLLVWRRGSCYGPRLKGEPRRIAKA
jgi:hypothetical protein